MPPWSSVFISFYLCVGLFGKSGHPRPLRQQLVISAYRDEFRYSTTQPARDGVMRLKITVVTPIFPIPSQPYRGHSAYQILLALSKHADVNVVCPFARYPRWIAPSFDHRAPDLSYSPA